MINLGDTILVERARFSGLVVAKAEYLYSETQFLVEHINALGDPVSSWFAEHEISFKIRDK